MPGQIIWRITGNIMWIWKLPMRSRRISTGRWRNWPHHSRKGGRRSWNASLSWKRESGIMLWQEDFCFLLWSWIFCSSWWQPWSCIISRFRRGMRTRDGLLSCARSGWPKRRSNAVSIPRWSWYSSCRCWLREYISSLRPMWYIWYSRWRY